MSNLQVKNIPESFHRRLKQYAYQRGRTLSQITLEALERELARAEFYERLHTRPQTELGVSASSLLDEQRLKRDEDL